MDVYISFVIPLSMILAFLDNLVSIAAVILLFAGTVFIHELGHFMTAKWFGLRIDVFAIGMGPAFWQKKVGDVVYKLCWLPIGGYVALPQMDITGSAFENEDAKAGKLEPVEPWKRIIIAAAGPFMNVIAALVIGTLVWGAGKQPTEGFQEPTVGWVSENSPVYAAGIREQDKILRVNGDDVNFWMDVQIAAMLNTQLDLEVERDGKPVNIPTLKTEQLKVGNRTFRMLAGIGPMMPEETGVRISNFREGSTAFAAGMRPGDIITAIDGNPIRETTELVEAVRGADGAPQTIEVLRGSKTLQFEVTAEWKRFFEGKTETETTEFRLGILMAEIDKLKQRSDPEGPRGVHVINFLKGSPVYEKGVNAGDLITAVNGSKVTSIAEFTSAMEKHDGQELELTLRRRQENVTAQVTPAPAPETAPAELETETPLGRWIIGITMDQVYEPIHPNPFRQVRYFSGQIFRTLIAFTRTTEIKQASGNIGSAVLIFKGMHSELSESVINGLWFTALINVNLAILNLMPLLILDGGHITLATFEWITGKRAPKKLITVTANVVVVLLISLMLWLGFKDVIFLVGLNEEENSATAAPVSTATPAPGPSTP